MPFAAAGVHPADLKELRDLAKFPFVSKADLRDHYPFGLFAASRSRSWRPMPSSALRPARRGA
jgi:phenylacetate-CoA ligase